MWDQGRIEEPKGNQSCSITIAHAKRYDGEIGDYPI